MWIWKIEITCNLFRDRISLSNEKVKIQFPYSHLIRISGYLRFIASGLFVKQLRTSGLLLCRNIETCFCLVFDRNAAAPAYLFQFIDIISDRPFALSQLFLQRIYIQRTVEVISILRISCCLCFSLPFIKPSSFQIFK